MADKRISYKTLSGTGIPVTGSDIDTDRIIPARFMKCVTFEGLGAYAFYDVRFNEDGSKKNHPFNSPAYEGASVLVVNRNFGCGSSREHAPQALQKFGIKAIIGESFAEIFAGNCTAMGIPAMTVSTKASEEIQGIITSNPKVEITLDLEKKQITLAGKSFDAVMPEAYRQSLVQGTWDSTGVLLENAQKIKATAANLPYVSGF